MSRSERWLTRILIAAFAAAALTAPGIARCAPPAPAGTVIVPDRFLRSWDPLTVFFAKEAGPAVPGPEDHPERVVTLAPDHPGAWSWVDARTLQFRPADPWPALARFSVAAGGARATLDTLLEPPRETVPAAGSTDLDPLAEITLVFAEPLDPAALARALTIEVRPLPGIGIEGATALPRDAWTARPLERAAPADPARYALRLREPIPWGRTAVVRLRLSLADDAASLAEARFSTAEPFRVVAAGPSFSRRLPVAVAGSRYGRDQAIAGPPEGRQVAIEFSAPPGALGPVEARNLVRFTPAVGGLDFSVEGSELLVRGDFARETLYRLDLEPAPLADRRGRPLEMRGGSTVWFSFPRPQPYLRWGAGQGILERLGPQMAPLEGRGEERVDLRIHRVDPLDRSFWPFPPAPVAVDELQRPPGPGEEPGPYESLTEPINPGLLARQIAALGSPAVSALVELPLRRERGSATFGLDLAPHLALVGGPREPGHYLVGLRQIGRSSTRLWTRVQVTDLALAAVEEPRAVRFVVTSIATGAPVAGAAVRIEGGHAREGAPLAWRTLAEGTTGADGAFTWAAPGHSATERRIVRRIVVQSGRDLLAVNPAAPPDGFRDNLWRPGEGERWLQWAFEDLGGRSPSPETLCHIYTERPLYRPEEEVFIAGWVRRRHRGQLEVAAGTGTLVVRGPGDLEWRFPVTLSGTGAFFQRFAQEKLPTGEYLARFDDALGRPLAEAPFRMEAYRLPLFEVRLHGPDTVALDGEATIGLTATYYAGGQVAGRPLQWRVTQFPHAWTPERRPGFFYSSDGRYSKVGRFEATPALVRQDATDAAGAGSVTLNPAIEPTAQPRQYVVEATVTGADDQTVTATKRVVALPPFVLGLKAPRYLERAERLEPEVLAVGPDGKPLAGLPVTVRLLRRSWHSVLRAGDFSEGAAKYQTDVVDEKILETTVTSAAAPVRVPLALAGAGVYVVELEARDRLGRAQSLAVDLYAGGAEPLAWPKAVAGVFTASPDRKEYAPGETATVVLASPFQTGRALAIVEAPEGNRYAWVEVRGGAASFAVPILPTFVPRLPVHFVLMRGRPDGTAPLPGTLTDLGRPTTVAATAWLAVKPVDNRVEVSVSLPERAQPGDEITVKLDLADPAGAPLPGEVALWLVDQAVLALAPERRLDPLPDFITQVVSRLLVRDTRNLVTGFLPFAELPGGEARSLEAADLFDRTTVRRTFRTVPYFNAAIPVGPDGKAEVRIRLPDNLTVFKVRAKAASGPARFGFAASQIAVRLPVIVQPALPRFVRPGDSFTAAATARIVEGPGGVGRGQMQVEGATLQAAGTTEFIWQPNAPERVEFPVVVPTPQFGPDGKLVHGEVVVRTAVERVADGARDAFEVRLPIRDDRERVRLRSIEELAPGVAAKIPALPEPARPGSVRRRLLVSDQPALVKMAAGLDFLMGYPYGCTEQRISEARAHLAFARFRDVLAMGEVAAASEHAVRQALEWLPGVVDEGGLAAYWPGGPGYVSLTAWGVRFLVEAKAAGHPVDQELHDRMVRALEQALRSDYGRFVDGESFTERCLALGALAAAGKFNAAYAADLARQARFLNLEGSAEVLLAFTGPGGEASPAVVRELAKKLGDGVATRLWQGREIYAGLREDWSGRNPLVLPDETAAVAVMAQALARANAEPAKQRILADALVALGRGDGWGTTRANAAALFGLAQFLSPPFEGSRPRRVAVRFGADQATLATDAARPVAVHATASAGAGEALLAGREAGPVVLRADTEYVPLADGAAVAPAAQGFSVSRELQRVPPDGGPPARVPLDAPGRTVAFAVGEIVEERVRVVNPADRHFVAIVVPLAAGMEPLNPNLATAPPEAKPSGSLTLAPTYAAYLDDAASFYYDTLPKGTYEFSFRTKATVAGSFVQPPAKAELMYDGAVRGNGAGARIEVARGAAP